MNETRFYVIFDQGLKIIEQPAETEKPEHIRGDRFFSTRCEAQAYLDKELDEFEPTSEW